MVGVTTIEICTCVVCGKQEKRQIDPKIIMTGGGPPFEGWIGVERIEREDYPTCFVVGTEDSPPPPKLSGGYCSLKCLHTRTTELTQFEEEE